MVLTFLLGLSFLFLQVNEYVHLGWAPHDSAQATIFYSLTGLHGAHVFVGLSILTFCLIRSVHGDFRPGANNAPLAAGAVYWHFVDVVWIILYLLVYILA